MHLNFLLNMIKNSFFIKSFIGEFLSSPIAPSTVISKKSEEPSEKKTLKIVDSAFKGNKDFEKTQKATNYLSIALLLGASALTAASVIAYFLQKNSSIVSQKSLETCLANSANLKKDLSNCSFDKNSYIASLWGLDQVNMQLKKDLEQCKLAKTKLNSEQVSQEGKINNLEKEINNINLQNKNRKSQINDLNSLKEGKESEIENLRKEMGLLEEKMKELKNGNSKLNQKLGSESSELSLLKNELNDAMECFGILEQKSNPEFYDSEEEKKKMEHCQSLKSRGIQLIQSKSPKKNSDASTDNIQQGTNQLLESIPKAQVTTEYDYCKGKNNPITIVTAYDDKIKEYAEPIVENQRAYAEKQGYCYAVYKGNLAHDLVNGKTVARAPYWSKIVAIADQAKKRKEGSWIVWMDASAIVSNSKKTFDKIIQKYGNSKNVILTTDIYQKGTTDINNQGTPINNAVFVFKINDWTKNWLAKIWSRSGLAIGGKGNCGSWSFTHCHYEQQAMTDLWKKDVDVSAKTALIDNRNMNSFYRFSHFDTGRRLNLDYLNDDEEKSYWKPFDFICKVTGMEGRLRNPMTRFILDQCIDKECTPLKTETEVLSYNAPKK